MTSPRAVIASEATAPLHMNGRNVHDDFGDEDDFADVNDADVGGEDEAPAESERVRVSPELSPDDKKLRAKLIVNVKVDKKTGEETHTLRPCSANVTAILRHHPDWTGVLRLNRFALRVEVTREPPWHELDAPAAAEIGSWTEADDVRLAHWLQRTWITGLAPMSVGTRLIAEAVIVAAEANAYHPVRDYLRSLTWDGTARVDDLASTYLGVKPSTYAQAVSASLMIGAVARVERPGCKLDTMVVLEGAQGTRKSTAIATLSSAPWFSDTKLPLGNKDAFQQLPGVWLYEIGELAALSKADVEEVKAFLSSPVDRFRPAFARHVVPVPRQTSFVGSTNAEAYLQDVTGGRRFLPLRTGRIDIPALEADRDQLWAEAFHRFDKGEAWWLDDELARPEQAARLVADEWEVKIATWLAGREHTTVAQILEELVFAERDGFGERKNNMGRWGQREANRVARCLTQLGWHRRQVRIDGERREWRYLSPVPTDGTSTDEGPVT